MESFFSFFSFFSFYFQRIFNRHQANDAGMSERRGFRIEVPVTASVFFGAERTGASWVATCLLSQYRGPNIDRRRGRLVSHEIQGDGASFKLITASSVIVVPLARGVQVVMIFFNELGGVLFLFQGDLQQQAHDPAMSEKLGSRIEIEVLASVVFRSEVHGCIMGGYFFALIARGSKSSHK